MGSRLEQSSRRIEGEAGASLAELAVVLAIMGILLVMGGGVLNGVFGREQTQTGLADLAGHLRYARHLAMTKHQPVRVLLDADRGVVSVTKSGSPGLLVTELRLNEKGITIVQSSAGPVVTFYPSGRSATGTTITIRNQRGETRSVTISVTGQVSTH
jgi:type IV fimbrial biogenesis protein FimT